MMELFLKTTTLRKRFENVSQHKKQKHGLPLTARLLSSFNSRIAFGINVYIKPPNRLLSTLNSFIFAPIGGKIPTCLFLFSFLSVKMHIKQQKKKSYIKLNLRTNFFQYRNLSMSMATAAPVSTSRDLAIANVATRETSQSLL
jgi:hypothetical protein